MFFNRVSPNQFSITKYRYISSSPVLANEAVRSIWLKPDGTKIYYIGSSAGILRSFDLIQPWDISTATNAASSSARLVNTGSVALSNPWGMSFNSSGTVLLVAEPAGGPLYKFNLSTAWDVTSVNTTASQQTVYSEVTGAQGMWLGNNDQNLLITTGIGTGMKLLNISSSMDLNTINYVSNVANISSTGQTGIGFTDNGNKIYFGTTSGGAGGNYYMLSVTSPYTTSGSNYYISSTPLNNITLVGANGNGDMWISNDGNYMYIAGGGGVFANRLHMYMVG